MKNRKLIGIAVALSGMLVAFGTSIAMYKSVPTELGFGIGKADYQAASGDLNYKVGTWTTPSAKPSPEHTTVNTKLALNATYPADVVAQPYIVGKFTVTVTLPTSLISGVSATAEVKGDGTHKDDYTTYWDNLYGRETSLVQDETNKYVLSLTKQICVPAGQASPTTENSMFIDLNINFGSSLTSANFFALAESGYSVYCLWEQDTSFNGAYFAGDANDWTIAEDSMMVPNLAHAGSWEWVRTGITGFTQGKFVSYNGSTYDWMHGDNIGDHEGETIVAANTYSAFWDGTLHNGTNESPSRISCGINEESHSIWVLITSKKA